MKIIVTGYKGFLGARVCKELSKKHDVVGLDKEEVEITDYSQVKTFFQKVQPELTIHCAAVGDIWKCEKDPDLGAKVNIIGTKNIASASANCNSRLIAISSDQVYNYFENARLSELQKEDPTNFYGVTKLEGEKIVRACVPQHHILRLSWQFGLHEDGLPDSRDGLLERAKKSLETGQKMNYTKDSRQNITYIYDTVDVIVAMAEQKIPYGTYNVASENTKTEYETIVTMMQKLGATPEEIKGLVAEVENGKPFDLRTEPYNLKMLGYPMPTFEEGLERCFKELVYRN